MSGIVLAIFAAIETGKPIRKTIKIKARAVADFRGRGIRGIDDASFVSDGYIPQVQLVEDYD